jgi:hypothetical protein
MFASLLIIPFLTSGIHLHFVVVITIIISIIIAIISDLRTNVCYLPVPTLIDWFL